MLSIGIVGEYLGRTYMETKQRPLYVVSDVFESGGTLQDRDCRSV
jgi:hypothetical protein